MTKILVTGGSGFIGSNFIHYIMKKGNYSVINLDNLTYAGNEKNNEDRYKESLFKLTLVKRLLRR